MLKQAQAIAADLTRLRRTIHQHPELGFKEVRTAQLVAETLRDLGLQVTTGVGKTGVVAELGAADGPTIAIRADMDALPIQEANDVPYRSQVPGVMHACGHDAHTAILMGVAMLLKDVELPGRVRLLFQPAEEVQDEEGKSGAMRMVEEGAMDGVDAVIALHVHSDTDTGHVEVTGGPVGAAVDSFYATIVGDGAHGAYPHRGLDPIWLAAQAVNALHGIVARRVDPIQPAVVSVGTIHGGTATNIIPAEVEISGTLRSLDPEVRRQLVAEVERALSVVRALGGDYRLRIKKGYPPLINDEKMAALIRQVAVDLLGEEYVHRRPPTMGAEDFSYMLERAPGAMFSLGVKGDWDEPRGHHTDTFDIDERALPIGAAILAETARRYLVAQAS